MVKNFQKSLVHVRVFSQLGHNDVSCTIRYFVNVKFDSGSVVIVFKDYIKNTVRFLGRSEMYY